MLGGSALRLGRDGYLAHGSLAYTCRQLSEDRVNLTVFVKAFAILTILYHVHAKKSNVFLRKTNIFFRREKTIDKPRGLCLNVSNTEKTLTENLPFHSLAAESRWVVRTGAGAKGDLIPESVLRKRASSETRMPALKDSACWSVKGSR